MEEIMLLRISNVSKSYGKTRALIDFKTVLTPGIYALLGPNGSGKSTLMNIITDNLKADSGVITFAPNYIEPEEDILKMGVRFREKLGYMPQYPGMYAGFTVERFLWYMATLKNVGGHLKGRERKEYIRDEITEVLTTVELIDASKKRIGALSGGMKQRLALAQAVLGDPEILILDEPTAGLDPKQRIVIRNFISRIAFNKIVIIATHVVSDVEYIAKEIIMLKKGVIESQGTVAELLPKIEGKVWSLEAREGDVMELQNKFRVTNISKNDEGVTLRILSDSKPTENAKPVTPTLEDYYLWVFNEEQI